MRSKIKICYLCGKQLNGKIDTDHVPPKQFYAKGIRKKHAPNLFTLPVHRSCHDSYQMDEDYFVHSIAPLAMESYSGKSLWDDLSKRHRRPEGERLFKKILQEFEPRPSGLFLPEGKVVKKFDVRRVRRIIWKLTRGLFFKDYGRVLPESTPRNMRFYSKGEKPGEGLLHVINTFSKGQYPGVFDYRHKSFPDLNNFHMWAMLFWDSLIVQVWFHDPDCVCKKCKAS